MPLIPHFRCLSCGEEGTGTSFESAHVCENPDTLETGLVMEE